MCYFYQYCSSDNLFLVMIESWNKNMSFFLIITFVNASIQTVKKMKWKKKSLLYLKFKMKKQFMCLFPFQILKNSLLCSLLTAFLKVWVVLNTTLTKILRVFLRLDPAHVISTRRGAFTEVIRKQLIRVSRVFRARPARPYKKLSNYYLWLTSVLVFA